MAFAMDTLGFAQRHRRAGIETDTAEAQAEAVRDFVMAELVTKADLADAMERQTLKLTVRLGGLLVAAIGALAVLMRLGL